MLVNEGKGRRVDKTFVKKISILLLFRFKNIIYLQSHLFSKLTTTSMNQKLLLYSALISFITFSCTKENIQRSTVATKPIIESSRTVTAVAVAYTTYNIWKGQHYSDKRPLKSVSTTEMKFFAQFDQSAIYQTTIPVNQYDINKLWGFSEGLNNQYNSARMGWGYSNGAIRLYGYVYSKGVRYSKEIATVLPGQEISCSIKISGSTYVISANGISVILPRGTTAANASGFQQYPYFGGDEVAPHDISIAIMPS